MSFCNCGKEAFVNIWKKRYSNSATDSHFWQEICKANDRTPKVSSWSCWLWCVMHTVWGEEVGTKWEKALWEHCEQTQKVERQLLAAAEHWCTLCGCAADPADGGVSTERPPRGSRAKLSSPLRTGHRFASQQSLCWLPAGRFSYANRLPPCRKESSC